MLSLNETLTPTTGVTMKFLNILLFLPILSLSATTLPTYEEIRQQVENEANSLITKADSDFKQHYKLRITSLLVTSSLASAFTALAAREIKNASPQLILVYSALAGSCGYLTLLLHSQLMEDTRVRNKTIATADQVYNKKMAHLHSRHYMSDIAKFIVTRLEALLQRNRPEVIEADKKIVTP